VKTCKKLRFGAAFRFPTDPTITLIAGATDIVSFFATPYTPYVYTLIPSPAPSSSSPGYRRKEIVDIDGIL
jgi:hypothetical protein